MMHRATKLLSRSAGAVKNLRALPALTKRNASTEVEEPKEQSYTDVINEFGWIPFVGLGASALITKEMFFLNEELLVAGLFSGIVGYGYVAYGHVLKEALDEEGDQFIKAQQEVHVAAIEEIEHAIKTQDIYVKQAQELGKIARTMTELEEDCVTALAYKKRQYAVEFFTKKLQDAVAYEEEKERVTQKLLLTNALKRTENKLLNLSEQERSKLFDSALASLTTAEASKEDFVLDVFSQEYKAYVADISKPLTAEEEAAIQKEVDAHLEGVDAKEVANLTAAVRKYGL